jgi:type II secretory pathway pseudopilin PulG
VTALLAGFVVAVVALSIALGVVLLSWWVRDRRRRRVREEARKARRDIDERAHRQVRLNVTPRAR